MIARTLTLIVTGSLIIGGPTAYREFVSEAQEIVAKANASEVSRYIYTYNALGMNIDRLMYEIGADPVDEEPKTWVYNKARFEWDTERNVLRSIVGQHCFEAEAGSQVRPDINRCTGDFEPHEPAADNSPEANVEDDDTR
jgi:hypothetical protein